MPTLADLQNRTSTLRTPPTANKSKDEAMVADRTYRMGIGAVRAREELENGAGTQFDPLVVQAFLAFLERADRALGVR